MCVCVYVCVRVCVCVCVCVCRRPQPKEVQVGPACLPAHGEVRESAKDLCGDDRPRGHHPGILKFLLKSSESSRLAQNK